MSKVIMVLIAVVTLSACQKPEPVTKMCIQDTCIVTTPDGSTETVLSPQGVNKVEQSRKLKELMDNLATELCKVDPTRKSFEVEYNGQVINCGEQH